MSAIYLPDGNKAFDQAQPEQSMVVIQTADGKTIGFPQVAVAMCSPDVINLIAAAVVKLLQEGKMVNEKAEFFTPEEPKA